MLQREIWGSEGCLATPFRNADAGLILVADVEEKLDEIYPLSRDGSGSASSPWTGARAEHGSASRPRCRRVAQHRRKRVRFAAQGLFGGSDRSARPCGDPWRDHRDDSDLFRRMVWG